MKLRFKTQAFQTAAVEAVADCFAGQPRGEGLSYRMDPGRAKASPQTRAAAVDEMAGFKNADIALSNAGLLDNIQKVQRSQNLPQSGALAGDTVCDVNLDVEMETGTGKTYCYIKTMFELNQRYGWTKFIVVVPSIAIREGVSKSFEITAEHFLQAYGKRARSFIYNSKQLHELESYSSDAGINVMIINVQAFNARGKDARRIYEELDDFQSRRPIDVIKANRPILILDEPQKMEGKKTLASLAEFNPLAILRYSATHRTEHNKIHRLDALDAYNQKLVKKIAVRGITVKGLSGTHGYLYLESIEIAPRKPPVARVEMEIKRKSGPQRQTRKLGKNDNLYDLSGGLEQYRGFVVADIDARTDIVEFTNGETLHVGQASGDVNEATLRRIQIREAIKAHLEKEQMLFERGVKVLSLFFIDEVAKYRQYDESGQQPGEYARIFEEEYDALRDEFIGLFKDTPYAKHLAGIDTARTHDGYFSIDKKSKRLVDPKVAKRGELAGEADDADAYDLILKDKERLLSFAEPVRFIFSHSALREGWDNPNVFVIGTLKHSDNTISRRQEVGRGLRLAVDQSGERMDDPATVHDTNVLTVVANESYQDFVAGLQRDISESLSARPRKASEDYFRGKVLAAATGEEVPVSAGMARQIEFYLIQNGYVDYDKAITETYHEAKQEGQLAPLPADVAPYADAVFKLIDSVFSDADLPRVEDDRRGMANPTNANFRKKEFLELWARINRKAAYTVHFETEELVAKCINALTNQLNVAALQYVIQRGEQTAEASPEALAQGQAFKVSETEQASHKRSVQSAVKYDLIGNLAAQTQLTRATVATILRGIPKPVFEQYRVNPEDFLLKAARLITEQKATVIVDHLAYDPIDDRYELDIFTQDTARRDLSDAVPAERHIYDYVFTDSNNERKFVAELDTSKEVVVYAKLPRGFSIPTPVGNYNPDWAIAFDEGKVRHVYFIAETKGSMSTMELREIEHSKIKCARRFFDTIASEQVRYDVVDSYDALMNMVSG